MKKINDNGFAISTMLYGLLIVMVLLMSLLISTMSFARSNNKKFVNQVINELESRDRVPPTVQYANSGVYMMEYTKTKKELSINFTVTDDSELSLSKTYSTTSFIGSTSFETTCTPIRVISNNTGETAVIECNFTIPDTNNETGIVSVNLPQIVDIYGNKSASRTVETQYKIIKDDVAPTFELISDASGQYHINELPSIKIKLCDNSKNDLTPRDETTKNLIYISGASNRNVNGNLEELGVDDNKCRIFTIAPFYDLSLIGKLKITIPGIENGSRYGWKDKNNNVNKKTELDTDITLVRVNEMAFQLEKFNKTTMNTNKAYILKGNINIEISRGCEGQPLETVGSSRRITPTCTIDRNIISDCTIELLDRKLSYNMKVDANNQATGRAAITIPGNVFEDCRGNRNSETTIYLGPTFVN